PCCRNRCSDHVMEGQPIVQQPYCQAHGKKCLHLYYQRCKSRRHSQLHRQKKQTKLAHADCKTVSGKHRPRNSGTAHKKYEGKGSEKEAQCGEQEWRKGGQCKLYWN